MIAITIDTGKLDEFRRAWNAGSQKALLNAFKGEAFRLKTVVQSKFAGGIGPSVSLLTSAQQKRQSSAALASFSRFIAYQVDEDDSRGITARIGLSQAVSKQRNPAGRWRQVVALLEGGGHAIGPGEQASIAYKIRRRLGEPVRRPSSSDVMGKAWHGRRRRYELGKRKWADLSGLIPKGGTSLVWPGRDYAAQVVAAEQSKSQANILRLYEMALRGERWAKVWWK